ncbi:MAG: flagellar basal-body MS-ring/collar protein FliF [Pseudomonadota bacterium]
MATDAQTLQPSGSTPPATDPQASLARVQGLVARLGPSRLVAFGGLALGLIAFAIFLGTRVLAPDYGLLFTELEPTDAKLVTDRLDGLGVPFRLTPDGSAVMVPEGDVLRLRMAFAEDGLPASGAVGYEIFDDRSMLGTTQFEANVSLLRALEGELARTIASMNAIRSARVHLVQPKRELFQRESAPASASVAVHLARRDGLGPEQIAAIRHLVAGAVPWLDAKQVTIVDDQGQLLAQIDDDGTLIPGRSEALQRTHEERLAGRITELLERSLGAGKVHVSVNADMDFDQLTTTSEEYDPESQVARSTQVIEEQNELVDREPGAVSVQNNLPAPNGGDGEDGPASTDRSSRTEETTNFEISRTVRNHVQSGGRVRRLSIAVLVDGSQAANAAGELVYNPRSEDELAAIEALVRSAAGVDAERGDVVEVVNRPFAATPVQALPEPSMTDVASGLWGQFGEAATLLLATVLVLLFAVRPLLRRAFPAPPKPALSTESGLTVTEEGEVLIEPGSSAAIAAEVDREHEEMLQISQIRGQIRASLLGRATSLIDDHPDEAIRVLRGWLQTAD